MAGVHMLIGLGEGLISALVLLGIARTRPEMVTGGQAAKPQGLELIGYGMLLALGAAMFVAPFACSWPDGLETVARRLGFSRLEAVPLIPAAAPEYRLSGMDWGFGATAVAGIFGTLLAFALAWTLGWVLAPKPNKLTSHES